MAKYMRPSVGLLSGFVTAFLKETAPYAIDTPHVLLNQLFIKMKLNTVENSVVNLHDREAITIYRETMFSDLGTNVAYYAFRRSS